MKKLRVYYPPLEPKWETVHELETVPATSISFERVLDVDESVWKLASWWREMWARGFRPSLDNQWLGIGFKSATPIEDVFQKYAYDGIGFQPSALGRSTEYRAHFLQELKNLGCNLMFHVSELDVADYLEQYPETSEVAS